MTEDEHMLYLRHVETNLGGGVISHPRILAWVRSYALDGYPASECARHLLRYFNLDPRQFNPK